MDQKVQFVAAYLSGESTVKDICRQFGISRATGYKLMKRYNETGFDGLVPDSRAPKNHPNSTPKEVEKEILRIRKEHKRYGAKKIRAIMLREENFPNVPAASTINAVLKRKGMVKRRVRRKGPVERLGPDFTPNGSGDIMSIDFKGKFRLGNGKYCYPLTLVDSHSCFLYACSGTYKPDTAFARRILTGVFRKHGIPNKMHSDNGPPFGCTRSLGRLTRLAVWLIERGVVPVFSDPASPQQNGRHERMHRELKAEVTRPPKADLRSQQRRMNSYVGEYNEYRPHEGLNQKTPSEIHSPQMRKFPEKVEEYVYPGEMLVRHVCENGAVRWSRRGWVNLTNALAGKKVGMRHVGAGLWEVYFRNIHLGYFDEIDLKVYDMMRPKEIPERVYDVLGQV